MCQQILNTFFSEVYPLRVLLWSIQKQLFYCILKFIGVIFFVFSPKALVGLYGFLVSYRRKLKQHVGELLFTPI